MKKNGIIMYAVLILIIVSGFGISFYQNKMNETKTGWVAIGKIYTDFALTKELESNLKATESARKNILDSLELSIRVIAKQATVNGKLDKEKVALFEVKKEEYINKKKTFEEDNTVLQKQYNEQVLIQINQYLKDYGKKNNYKYIYGGDGTGTLMYADDKNDITQEVVAYINDRYKGKAD